MVKGDPVSAPLGPYGLGFSCLYCHFTLRVHNILVEIVSPTRSPLSKLVRTGISVGENLFAFSFV